MMYKDLMLMQVLKISNIIPLRSSVYYLCLQIIKSIKTKNISVRILKSDV